MDKKLEQIAKDIMGIGTLETRHSDSLDFYDISVWRLKEMLEAAYQAGRDSAEEDGEPHKVFKEGDYVFTSSDALISNSVGKIVDFADDDYPGTKEHYIVDFDDAGTCTVHKDDMRYIKPFGKRR